MAPEEFRSLGLDHTDEEREEYLVELVEEIWPGGSVEQQEHLIAWYRDVASAAAADGAVYTGVCMLGVEDDRVSTASLTARCEPMSGDDAEVAARALVEGLGTDEFQEVHRADARRGPAVLVLSGFEAQPGGEGRGRATAPNPREDSGPALVFARADVYCPLPQVSQLLVLSLTTPTLSDLPWYVSRLSEIADTIDVPARPSSASPSSPLARSASSESGTARGGSGASPITAFL